MNNVIGKVFSFPETATHGIVWAAIREHDIDPNWILVIPLDSNLVDGDLDIRTSTTKYPQIARIGCGFWASLDELNSAEQVSSIGMTDINNINKMFDILAKLNNVDPEWSLRTSEIVGIGGKIFK